MYLERRGTQVILSRFIVPFYVDAVNIFIHVDIVNIHGNVPIHNNTEGRATDNKAYHHGNPREELVTEAMKVLREQNIKAVTLRKLSNSLEVSRAALYRHFRNKEALLTSVAALGFKMMRESFDRNTQPEKPENALAAIMKNYIIFATGNHMLYELMFSRGIFSLLVPEELRKVASDAYSEVTEILQRMKSENDSVMSIKTVWAWFIGSPF